MTVEEFKELYNKIMEDHSWRNLGKTHKKNNKDIKYLDCSIDTRTGEVWRIKFRGMFEDKTFKGKNIKQEIKEWLKEKR